MVCALVRHEHMYYFGHETREVGGIMANNRLRIYMASNSIYGLAFNRFAACLLAVSIAWVKCERRVRYSCTLPFDTLFSRATLVSLIKNFLHEQIFFCL